jgi:hypothetical protein
LDTLGKIVPDALTVMRIVFAGMLAAAGLDGRADLGREVWLLVASWTTDMIDGRLSRTWLPDYHSWLGQQDVYIDMFVSLSALFYLVMTGLLPLWVALVYLLVWGVLFLLKGVPAFFAQVFQNPIYAVFVFLAVQAEPWVLPWLLLWALLSLLLFGRRLVEIYNESVRFLRR